MNNKIMGYVLAAFGVVLFGVSAGADLLGFGEGYVFGTKQMVGCVIGMIGAGLGLFISLRQLPAA